MGTFIKYTDENCTTHNTLCLAKCVVRFRENKIMMLKKAASQNKKKRKGRRRSNQLPMALDWKENCLVLAT